MKIFISILTILSVSLGGCGLLPFNPQWTHPTKSETQIDADHASCVNKVWASYPYKEGDYTTSSTEKVTGSPASVTCKTYSNETICHAWPEIPDSFSTTYEKKHGDMNSISRSEAYEVCMIKIDPRYQCIDNRKIGLEKYIHGSYCGHRDKK